MSGPVGVCYNPISGGGRAKRAATELAELFSSAGIPCSTFETRPRYEPGEVEQHLRSIVALVVAGGDGTIMGLLEPLALTQVPVYMMGFGNESLFARAFGMAPNPRAAFAAVERMAVTRHFYATVNDRPFFSMVSVGLDSEVVSRIAKSRTGPIGFRGYVGPTCAGLLGFRVPKISLSVRGEPVVEEELGYINIASSPHYARSLNPVADASTTHEELVARFYPHRSTWWYLTWLPSLLLGRPIPARRSRRFAGTEMSLSTVPSGVPVQADGECVGETPVLIRRSSRMLLVLESVRQFG